MLAGIEKNTSWILRTYSSQRSYCNLRWIWKRLTGAKFCSANFKFNLDSTTVYKFNLTKVKLGYPKLINLTFGSKKNYKNILSYLYYVKYVSFGLNVHLKFAFIIWILSFIQLSGYSVWNNISVWLNTIKNFNLK